MPPLSVVWEIEQRGRVSEDGTTEERKDTMVDNGKLFDFNTERRDAVSRESVQGGPGFRVSKH